MHASPPANANQLILRPQKDPPASHGWRREDGAGEVVARDDLQGFGCAGDVGYAGLGGEVEQVAGDDGGGGEAVADAVEEDQLAGGGVEAAEDAGVVGGVESALHIGGRRHSDNVRKLKMLGCSASSDAALFSATCQHDINGLFEGSTRGLLAFSLVPRISCGLKTRHTLLYDRCLYPPIC